MQNKVMLIKSMKQRHAVTASELPEKSMRRSYKTFPLVKLGLVAVLLVSFLDPTTGAYYNHNVPSTINVMEFNDHSGDYEAAADCTLNLVPDSNCLNSCVHGYEWLEYLVSATWQNWGLFKITIRASSKDSEPVRLYFNDERLGDDLELPGGGIEKFVGRSVSGVDLEQSGRLRVEFPQGEVYLCSISFSIDCPSEPGCVDCLNRNGLCSWSFLQDKCVAQSECNDYDDCEWRNHMKKRCTVDCSGIDDCDECIDKDGCGWVPNLGKCIDCQYNNDYEYDYECWDSWWDHDSCPFDHCYRMDTCSDCLSTGDHDCVWWYKNDLACRPGESCALKDVECFSFKDDVADSGMDVTEFCQGLDDPTCAERITCRDCLQDDMCGWLHRAGMDGGEEPLCLPAPECEETINCYTFSDFDKVDDAADENEFCEALTVAYDVDAEICAEAEGCRDCMKKELTFFDRCKWFHRIEQAEITEIFYDCGLECHDFAGYDGCIEQPETCPCVPEATCEECLRDGCGYWAEDKSFWNYGAGGEGRCYHFCRDGEYEYNHGDQNCFIFDDSLGLTPAGLCADHDACEGISTCKGCKAQKLPTDPDKTCVWLHDRLCASRCDTRCGDISTCEDNVGEDYDGYDKQNGACRKTSNGNGAGNNGDEYELYRRKKDKDVGQDWCKNKCDDQSDCKGFEYRDEGDDSHCEVWTYPFQGYDPKDDHYCYQKIGADDGDNYRYEKRNGACRKNVDGTGKGHHKDEYDLYKRKNNENVDEAWCKKQCDDRRDCTGFEYRNEGFDSHCEVWTHDILGYEGKDDHYCYVKKHD